MDKIVTKRRILSQISAETTLQEIEELDLLRRLRAANKTAWTKGSGLAAIQIGIPVRFAWYNHNGREGQLINPVITQRWGSDTAQEGCLSIPNKWMWVERSWTIEYETGFKRKRNTVSGFLARMIQHEVDHMDGILINGKEK